MLGELARTLHVPTKDLSICGTKDKRAATTQTVSLKRGRKSLLDVWSACNPHFGGGRGGRGGRGRGRGRGGHSGSDVRVLNGVRIGDLRYSDTDLDLGHLKGNRFVITLRSIRLF